MRRFLSVGVFALVAVTLPAWATVITFPDRTAFDAATGPQRLIDFEQYEVGPLCPYVSTSSPCTFRTEGVTFVSTLGDLNQRPLLEILDIGIPPSRGLISDMIPAHADDFYWSFTARYMGLDVRSFGPGLQPHVVSLTDVLGTNYWFSLDTVHGSAFFGFLSDTPISRMAIYAVGCPSECYNFVVDNLAFGTVSEPPMALLLFGAAVAFALVTSRRPAARVGVRR
jgi:hypothetical protein